MRRVLLAVMGFILASVILIGSGEITGMSVQGISDAVNSGLIIVMISVMFALLILRIVRA